MQLRFVHVAGSLAHADIVKVSDDELQQLVQWFSLPTAVGAAAAAVGAGDALLAVLLAGLLSGAGVAAREKRRLRRTTIAATSSRRTASRGERSDGLCAAPESHHASHEQRREREAGPERGRGEKLR